MQPINYTDQMQRSLDSFCQKKVANAKVVKRKWKIEKNNKEQEQNLEHYRMLPGSGTKERRNKKEEFFTKN